MNTISRSEILEGKHIQLMDSMILFSSSSFFILCLPLSVTSQEKVNNEEEEESEKVVPSRAFSLFFSLKDSRASMYSFSCRQSELSYLGRRKLAQNRNRSICYTFFWQLWPRGRVNSLFAMSIFFSSTIATSILKRISQHFKFLIIHKKNLSLLLLLETWTCPVLEFPLPHWSLLSIAFRCCEYYSPCFSSFTTDSN